MDNKAISVQDGIPGGFTMGGICAGASGRFLELTARRLGVDITELGKLALKGDFRNVAMNSYCIVFGTQSLVNSLSLGSKPEDVARGCLSFCGRAGLRAAAVRVEVKEPVIMVAEPLS
jgi:predicted CoA-substrate-specific enzyme activase